MREIRRLLKESAYTIISQIVSLCSSIVLSFLLPKFISIDGYGYWQFFLLLSSFTGVFLLGFGDGLFLIIGGEKFNSLNKVKWFPQIWISCIVQILIASCVFLYAYIFIQEDETKRFLFYILSIYVIIENFFKVLAFILMATDKIIRYSSLVMIDKSVISVSVVILILLGDINVVDILIVYAISHLLILIICLRSNFSDLFCYRKINIVALHNYFGTIKLGFILTMSNIVGMFIVGSGRFIIEYFWDIEVFAKVSLALSVSSFLLFFVSQISYVLYPFLRNSSTDTQSLILERGSNIITVISIFFFALFFPLYYIVEYWLPEYNASLQYLIILAPLSLFEVKNNLLYLTYFKNLCKIRSLLLINIITVIVAMCLYTGCAYLRSIDALVISILLAIIVKTLLMQIIIYKHYGLKYDIKNIWELFIVVAFISSYYLFGMTYLSMIYFIMVIISIPIYGREIKYFTNLLRRI